MHFKKILCAAVSAAMLFSLAACGKNDDSSQADVDDLTPVSSGAVHVNARNPLTGLYDLALDKVDARPVGVMVNNLRPDAWGVQTGVDDADLVYEMVAEGGITRFFCLYQDISKVSNIGSVRSTRYSYGDLAVSHDALLVHCGMDELYARSHFQAIGVENYDLEYHESAGFRLENGEAYEHTLYTNGEQLAQILKDSDIRMTSDRGDKTWLNFSEPEDVHLPGGGACEKISVPFSYGYTSTFVYDSESGRYLKEQGGQPHRDYRSGKQLSVENVFVLFTKVTDFPDAYHVKQDLTSGEGYYVSAGGYQKIKWEKGDASTPLSFTDESGNPLTCNAGQSWVCITSNYNRDDVEIIGGASSESEQA